MNLTFHLDENTVSGNEFINRTGKLTERERQFLEVTKETAMARIEPVDERLVRYQSYFDLSDEDFANLQNSVHKSHHRKPVCIAANQLSFPKAAKSCVYLVELGYTHLTVSRISPLNGKCEEVRFLSTVDAMQGLVIVASDLFNWIASVVKDVISEKDSKSGELVKVVFSSTMRLSENGDSIDTLSGGFRQKRSTDSAFKSLICDDPIIHVPLKELLNHAFHVASIPAKCIFVADSSYLQLAATKAQGWGSDAFMSFNISDGCRASVMEFGLNNVNLIRGVSFKECIPALPANNIDQNLNFAQCSSRTSNPLGRMITTESIAELVRMSWCHIMQERVSDICWKANTLSTTHVLTVVYRPHKVADVMQDWLGQPACDLDVKMFKALCDAVVRRAQLVLAAVIAGLAEASGRVYQAFGVGKCIIHAKHLSEFPEFIAGIQEVASKAVEGGDVELHLIESASCQGAALVANCPETLRKLAAGIHH